MLGVVGVGSISPLFAGPSFFKHQEFLVGWGPLAGLPWIPPPHVRALPGSTNFVGTNAQAHLLVMSLNINDNNNNIRDTTDSTKRTKNWHLWLTSGKN